MRNFFRKITQKLISKNKISTYLIYAIGEILLVIIGILIALSINNWSQDNTNRKSENEILIGLSKEFKVAKIELETDQLARMKILSVSKRILDVHLNNKTLENLPTDSIQSFFSRFFVSRFFTSAHPVLDDLQTSGRLALISSDKLRYALSKYLQEMNRLRVVEENEKLFVNEQLISYFSNYLDLSLIENNRISGSEIDLILNSIEPSSKLGSILQRRITITEQAIQFGELLNQSIIEVQSEIDANQQIK